jgi:hypothetical protein
MSRTRVRPEHYQGICVLLSSALAELRRIKVSEGHWIDRYLAISATVLIFSQLPNTAAHSLEWILVTHLGIFGWFEFMLVKERFAYYRTARTVVRYQDLLGLIEIGAVPQHHTHPYPEGFCPNPTADGTRRCSSFLRRQCLLVAVHCLICIGVVLASDAMPFGVVTSLIAIVSIPVVLYFDKTKMIQECRRELEVAGDRADNDHAFRLRA